MTSTFFGLLAGRKFVDRNGEQAHKALQDAISQRNVPAKITASYALRVPFLALWSSELVQFSFLGGDFRRV